ncbi:MAG: RNA 2',3'-cyclic phosphodiesterase [Candidatus Micrarchaeia archaeon]
MLAESGAMRAFIAIEVPEQIRQRIASLGAGLGGFRSVGQENMHITLFFLGSITFEQMQSVKSAMDKLAIQPFAIEVSGVGSFTQSVPRVLFAKISQGAENIIGIFRIMRSEIAACCKIEDRELVPHITIARARNASMGFKEATEFISRYKDYNFGRFQCDAITLKKSVLSSKGPEYANLYVRELS